MMGTKRGSGGGAHRFAVENGGYSYIRIILCVLVALVTGLLVWLLGRPAMQSVDTEAVLPKIDSRPVYSELHDGDTLEVSYVPEKDMTVRGLELLLVNTEGDTDALLKVSVRDSEGATLHSGDVKAGDLSVGEWTKVDTDMVFVAGETITIAFTAQGFEPYFMTVHGYTPGISLGFDVLKTETLRYGDIFYYSIPLVILIGVALIFIIMFGFDRVRSALHSLRITDRERRMAGELFLVLIFATISLMIIRDAYINGVYITADSDGYLREAVNLVAGNGFAYDGLAGYGSWFANWPIVYPAMIAAVMACTGFNAYLASKVVAIIILALIILVLRAFFGKNAWIYSLALFNTGIVMIFYHTWSEIPFILFMLVFALALGRIVSEENPSVCMYVVLTISGTLCFLTRYFGIFLWVVAGMYWLLLLIAKVSGSACRGVSESKRDGLSGENMTGSESGGVVRAALRTLKNDTALLRKLTGLAVSAVASVAVYLGYLLMNKIKNGAPTGVSRSDWWDDYHTLTDDLINSVVTEIFNALTIDVPAGIAGLDVNLKVWFIIAVDILIATVIIKALGKYKVKNNTGNGAKNNVENNIKNNIVLLFNPGVVLIVTSLVYYAMFIVIRYRSSMDTFYFRFFAPASLMLVLGIIRVVMGAGDKAAWYFGECGCNLRSVGSAACVLAGVVVLALFTDCMGDIESSGGDNMYEICAGEWDVAYRDVPERSVVIWSGLDYRSTWYRPDVVGGQLYEDDTLETLRERYYGSQYLCISTEYVDTILAEGNYAAEIKDAIREACADAAADSDYVVINLK